MINTRYLVLLAKAVFRANYFTLRNYACIFIYKESLYKEYIIIYKETLYINKVYRIFYQPLRIIIKKNNENWDIMLKYQKYSTRIITNYAQNKSYK